MEPIFHSTIHIRATQFLAKISFREIGILGQFSLSLALVNIQRLFPSVSIVRMYIF